MTNVEILAEIERLEDIEVKGTPCEVYSRIAGYFRPIKDWNKGQEAQFKERVNFDVGGHKHG